MTETNANPWTLLSGAATHMASDAHGSLSNAWVLVVTGTEHRVGASMTALALAEAAVGAGLDVLLVDGAVPRWSGLRTALTTEGPRIRRDLPVCEGRRGALPVRALESDRAGVELGDFLQDTSGRDLVIVDAGATLAGSVGWLSIASAWVPVAAITLPGLARAEAALEETASTVAVPPAGVSGIATSVDPHVGAGFRLERALSRHWQPMPRRAEVEAAGATPGPLPAPMLEAAARLLHAVTPDDLATRIPASSQRGLWRRNR